MYKSSFSKHFGFNQAEFELTESWCRWLWERENHSTPLVLLLTDAKEIHWSVKSFLFSKNKPDTEHSAVLLCVSSFPLGPPVMSHTVWDDVPNGWPGARNTKKPSSLVVWARAGGAIGLVYIEIKAEKWETAVYILGGLFSVFPSTPRENLSQGVMKNASPNWTCEMWNRTSTRFSLQFKMWAL